MTDTKKDLTEQDIRTKYITPAIIKAGWDEMTQMREEVYFTKGRIEVRHRAVSRGKAKKADYVLYYRNNFPIAIIEAKDNNHSVGDGMQQAMAYAETLDISFAYSSNGDGFLEHDFFTGKEKELKMHELPSPAELYERYTEHLKIDERTQEVMATPYHSDGSSRSTLLSGNCHK